MTELKACLNCSTELKGSYCYQCGQSIKGADRFFLTLVNEAFEDIFSSGSRVWKTLGNLLFRPGFLSTEYFSGRRVRYIPPIRLYFTLSILFFLVVSIATFFNDKSTAEINLETNENDIEITANNESQENIDENNHIRNQVREALRDANKQGGDLKSNTVNLNFPGFSEERNQAINARLESQINKSLDIYQVDPGAASDYFLEIAPPIIFCLLPLFALLLKTFYIRKGFYYTQHLILALHNHCFIFLWMMIFTLVNLAANDFGETPWLITTGFYIWSFCYLWRSLRNVYQEGRVSTAIKFGLLSVSYFLLAFVFFIAALIFGVMTV